MLVCKLRLLLSLSLHIATYALIRQDIQISDYNHSGWFKIDSLKLLLSESASTFQCLRVVGSHAIQHSTISPNFKVRPEGSNQRLKVEEVFKVTRNRVEEGTSKGQDTILVNLHHHKACESV